MLSALELSVVMALTIGSANSVALVTCATLSFDKQP